MKLYKPRVWSTDDAERNRRRRAVLFIAAMLALEEEERVNYYWQKLNEEGRQRRDRRIPRCALVDPQFSPWQKVYKSGDDGAMITVTGFDNESFQRMLQLFAPYLLDEVQTSSGT